MSIIDHVLGKDTWIPPEETPCYNDPDVWTDSAVQRQFPESKTEAKRACKTICPFKKECLEYIMRVEKDKSHFYRYGIWGGTTPHERYQMFLNGYEFDNKGETK